MAFEIDFLPVGNGTRSGDAICMRYGSALFGYGITVIDGGYTETGDAIVDHINNYYDRPNRIENVVLTHGDKDHVSGLFKVLESFEVGTLWMNRPWLHAGEVLWRYHANWTEEGLRKHLKKQFAVLLELEELAVSKGVSVMSPFQGSAIGPLTVLAPTRARYLDIIVELPQTPQEVAAKATSVFSSLAVRFEEAIVAVAKRIKETWSGETLTNTPEPTSASNESSVVQGGMIDGKKVLLTGDVGPAGLAEAFAYGYALHQPDVVQVPHHGSRRNVTPDVLDDWLGIIQGPYDPQRGVAVCSAAKNDADHPRAKVENAFLRRGYPVFSTKGVLLYYGHDMPGRGFTSATPASFRTEVEE